MFSSGATLLRGQALLDPALRDLLVELLVESPPLNLRFTSAASFLSFCEDSGRVDDPLLVRVLRLEERADPLVARHLHPAEPPDEVDVVGELVCRDRLDRPLEPEQEQGRGELDEYREPPFERRRNDPRVERPDAPVLDRGRGQRERGLDVVRRIAPAREASSTLCDRSGEVLRTSP